MAEEARQIIEEEPCEGWWGERNSRVQNLRKACFGNSHMNNNTPNRVRRIAFMLSGMIDALIGGVLLLLGFGFLPVDVTAYGFQNWHAILLGGILFATGMGFVVYNASRWDE